MLPRVPFEIDLPFTGGLDETSDTVTSDPPQLLRADNAVFTKRGAVQRRPGMDAKATTGVSGQRANAIFERGGGPHMLTDAGVYSWEGVTSTWKQTNPRGLQPCQVRTVPAVRVENDNVVQPDSCVHSGGYIATVWAKPDASLTGAVGSTTRCYVQITEYATGAIVCPPTQLPSTMRGCPHVAQVQANFVIVALGSDGHIYSCAMAPTAAVPGSATDTMGVQYTIYDVAPESTAGLYVAAARAGATTFDVFELGSAGTVVVSKTAIASSVGVSIRGICCHNASGPGRVYVAYCDGTGATLTDSQVWLGSVDQALVTWTQTGTVHGTFSPRTAGNGCSLAYADMALVWTTQGIYIAWSCALAVTTDGSLKNENDASVVALTAATNLVGFNTAGTATLDNPSTTRGYRLLSRWNTTVANAVTPYIALGWWGVVPLQSDGASGKIMSNRSPDLDTLYPGGLLCTVQSGVEWDPTQGAITTRTSTNLRAVARFNRDVANSYILGPSELPSVSTLWTVSVIVLGLTTSVKRQSGKHVPGTVVYEANRSTFDFSQVPARKVKANGGTWLDGGVDGGFDGQESFESSLHQPIETTTGEGLTEPIAPGDTITTGPYGSPRDQTKWHVVKPGAGTVHGKWYVAFSASWVDADGGLHRSPLSRIVTVDLASASTDTSDVRTGLKFPITDPGVLSAIELYGRLNVRIQVYISQQWGDSGSPGFSTDTTPYLAIDDVIGSDTRNNPSVLGNTTHGYAIAMNGFAGLPYVLVENPGEHVYANTLITHYSFGSVLAAEPSHALADLVAWQDRLVGIDAEDLLRLPYSKPFEERVAPEWNGNLSIRVPAEGGSCIGLAVMDEKLIVIKEHAVYIVVGNGATATGQQEQFSIQRLPSDIGCTSRNSIVVAPDGVLFLSQRGPVLLDRGLVIRRPKSLPDTFTGATCALVVPHLQTIVWGNAFQRLVQLSGGGGEPVFAEENGSATLNYEQGQWSLWFPFAALDMVMINDAIWRLDVTGQNGTVTPGTAPLVAVENANTNADPQGNYPLDVQTAWLKMAGVSGFVRLWRFVARLPSGCGLTLAMYADYDDLTVRCSSTWTAAEVAAVPQQTLELHVAFQKCASASFRITEAATAPNFNAGTVIEGMTLRGLKTQTTTKRLPAGARK